MSLANGIVGMHGDQCEQIVVNTAIVGYGVNTFGVLMV
jgi:hypothetical protein